MVKNIFLKMAATVCFGLMSFFPFFVGAEETQNKEVSMQDFTVVHKPPMMVIGIQCRTSNAADAGPKDIPQLWEKFYAENIYNKVPNKASDEVIALYCDYEGDHTKAYSCVIGCPVNSLEKIPEGMVGKQIPESTFALYHARGDFPKSLIDTWNKIWHTDLKRTYIGDYEVYGPKFFEPVKEVDVLVAIEN